MTSLYLLQHSYEEIKSYTLFADCSMFFLPLWSLTTCRSNGVEMSLSFPLSKIQSTSRLFPSPISTYELKSKSTFFNQIQWDHASESILVSLRRPDTFVSWQLQFTEERWTMYILKGLHAWDCSACRLLRIRSSRWRKEERNKGIRFTQIP